MDSKPLLTFPKWSNKLALGSLVLLATGPVYVGLLLAYGANPTTLNVGYAPVQPVPYSHALHVGKLGLDCRYCHNTVEKSGMAALPSTETCMNCHTAILPNSAKLAPVRESYTSGMPIPWVKVHDIADYVYFNHQRPRRRRGGLRGMPRTGGSNGDHADGQAVEHGLVPGLPPRSGTVAASERPNYQYAMDAADRSGRLRPGAQEEVRCEHQYGLCDMPSMTPPDNGARSTGFSRDPAEPPPKGGTTSGTPDVLGPRYWRSLEQLADTPEFRAGLERQPALGAEEALHASRRRFLQTMGASLGLAGLATTGCIRLPEEKLAPYAHRPENRTPGNPVSYATALEIGGMAQGLLVTSYDGRPIKIEGNPSHPLNRGAADVLAQASVLELYDPDRSRGVTKRSFSRGRSGDGPDDKLESYAEVASWDEFRSDFIKQIPAAGTGFCVLSEASNSPSLAAMWTRFHDKFPGSQWYEYEAVSDDNVREGTFAAFGEHVLPVLELADAKVIVSLDADLFGGGSPLAVKYARDFAARRKLYDKNKQKPDDMNRLYVIESLHTITGASADHRLARGPGEIGAIARELAAVLGVHGVKAPKDSKLPLLDSIIADLQENVGHAVVVAGSRQPAEVHALVAAINHKLGNVGKTVVYYPDPQPKRPSHAGHRDPRQADGVGRGLFATDPWGQSGLRRPSES